MRGTAYYCTVEELQKWGRDDIPEQFRSNTHLIYSSPATLAFNSPGAEGFGVKRAGLAIPDSIMLIVAPGCCGRNTSMISSMPQYEDRFFYLTMDETDIVTGRHLKKVPKAVQEICDSLAKKPSVVMICITCVDALLGTDMERVCRKAEEKTGLPLDFIRNKLTDFTISSSQIEDITGEKLVTMADAGVTHNTLEEFVQAVKLLSSFKQIKAEDMAAEYKLLGDDAGYFMLELKDGMTKVYIGVPKDKNDKATSFVVEYTDDGAAAGADTIVWKIKFDYEICEVGEIDVPDETLSKETIELLKKVYGYLE